MAGGALLLFVSQQRLVHWIFAATEHAMREDPLSAIGRKLRLMSFTADEGHRTFAAAYLLSHGLVKLALVAGLWRGVTWVYPIAIAIFVAFGAWQIVHLVHAWSAMLFLLTVADVLVIGLTWIEWRRQKRSR